MPRRIKYLLFSSITWILFFALLEGISRIFFVQPGISDYLERRILEQGLSKNKTQDEFRILLYGESTMQGDALHSKSTIEKWIGLYLRDVLGEASASKVRIYNLARLGCNSRFIAESFAGTLPYEPDLAVFYSAHNDFVQLDNRHTNFDLKPPRFGQKGFFEKTAKGVIRQSAFLSELNRLYIRFKIVRHQKRDATRRKSDLNIETWEKFYNPVYDALEPDSPVFLRIYEIWRDHIRRIIRIGRRHATPVVFFEGISNLKEYAPNESAHRRSLEAADLARWERWHRRAELEWARGCHWRAKAIYRRCLALDPEYALTAYRLGQCYEESGDFEKAKKFYKIANDEDRVPLRAPSIVNRLYERMRRSGRTGVHVIRTEEIFGQNSENGIIEHELMLDTMHPSVKGQALMALEIVRLIHRQRLLPKSAWRWDRLRAFDEMVRELDLDKDFEYNVFLSKANYVGRFYDKAIVYSKKALQLRPDSTEARRSLAWAYWRKGEKEEALAIYSGLYKEKPKLLRLVFAKNPELAREVLRRRLGRRLPFSAASTLV